MHTLKILLTHTAMLALLTIGMAFTSTPSKAHGYHGGGGYGYYQPYYGGNRGYRRYGQRYYVPRGHYGYYNYRYGGRRYNDRNGYGYSLNRRGWYGY